MNKHVFMSSLVFIISMLILFVGLPAAADAPPFTTISGRIGPGAQYEIAMPTAPWNGELVVYAHGIVSPNEPLSLPDIGPLRDTLTSQGFALIYSSFSMNGYGAVKDGMQRTHQLRGIFASRVAQPTHVYLVGTSLGGLIAVMLAERFPDQYDGVLAVGGLVGGGIGEMNYVVDARILFDYFFPGVIPGTIWYVPPDIDLDQTFTAVYEALIQGFDPPYLTLQFAAAAKLPVNEPEEIITTAMYLVGFDMEFAPNLMALTYGLMPYDNTKIWYSGSVDDGAMNAGVARYASNPSAVNYMKHYYTTTGDLKIPVITLHAKRDPIVPIFHEDIYAVAVTNAGASQYLLQRQFDEFGHTGISDTDVEEAFFALVQWVHSGVKPQN